MEDEIYVRDKLNFKIDKDIRKLIGSEEILFSDKIIKINDYGFSQERNILITDKNIYNLKKKSKYNFYNFNKIKYMLV